MPGLNVTVSGGPPPEAWTTISDYAGGSNLVYQGSARSFQPTVTLTVTSVSKANPAVVTVTTHGLPTGATVVISGGTGDWAGLNGTQTITNTGANTFTVPVNSSAFASTFAGTITTNSPQTSAAIWAIQKNFYTANQLTNTMWAVSPFPSATAPNPAGGSVGPVNIWDNRASLFFS